MTTTILGQPINDRTQWMDLPLPHIDNFQEDDVPRLRAGLEMIDAGVQLLMQEIDTKADATQIGAALDQLILEMAKKASTAAMNEALALKQNNFVSGETLKTINGASLLGAGNIQIGNLYREARTSNTALSLAEKGKLIDITTGNFTQTFNTVANLGQGWFCYLRNSSTGDVTLDPNASETLDGLTSFIMYPGEVRLLLCDGAVLRSVVINAFAKNYLSSGTFVKPPGYIGFEVEVIGGGQGGEAGRSGFQQGGSIGTVNGAAGGVPGARRQAFIPSGRIASSVTVTVGAGGLGGTTQGASGSAGGASIFGATAMLSSGSSGVPEITTIVGTGSIGGAGGSISYNYSVANPSSGTSGAYIGSGVTIPSGGSSQTYGYIPNTAGTYRATGTAGQVATADFCSGAGGGTATCRMEGNNYYTSDVVVQLAAGKGGNGGIGAGGGAGGHALAIWGSGGGLSGSPTFNLTHGNGGNGGPGLVSIWGVI